MPHHRPRHPRSAPPSPDCTPAAAPGEASPPVAAPTPLGVGIDTSRYGHHATFLRPDLRPAAADLDFAESAQGYQQLRERLDALAQRFATVACPAVDGDQAAYVALHRAMVAFDAGLSPMVSR